MAEVLQRAAGRHHGLRRVATSTSLEVQDDAQGSFLLAARRRAPTPLPSPPSLSTSTRLVPCSGSRRSDAYRVLDELPQKDGEVIRVKRR